MKLTKQQAVEEHRKLWNWIADETLKRKRKVRKNEYFNEVYPSNLPVPQDYCFCCEYDKNNLDLCRSCPIEWPCDDCSDCYLSPYRSWIVSIDYKAAAEYARDIAELPEREDEED